MFSEGKVFATNRGPRGVQQKGCLFEYHAQGAGVGGSSAQLVGFVVLALSFLVKKELNLNVKRPLC